MDCIQNQGSRENLSRDPDPRVNLRHLCLILTCPRCERGRRSPDPPGTAPQCTPSAQGSSCLTGRLCYCFLFSELTEIAMNEKKNDFQMTINQKHFPSQRISSKVFVFALFSFPGFFIARKCELKRKQV
jgi:hypothetical protein